MIASNINSKTDPEDRDYWATPNEIYNGAIRYFVSKGLLSPESLYVGDVCASKHNTKHERFFSEDDNALEQDWAKFQFSQRACGVLWCNPPYSRGKKEEFILKATMEAKRGVNTIMLLPADTSAKWFSDCVKNAKVVAFICNGRISFINNKTGVKVHGNNAGSVLVLFGERETKVARTLYVTKNKLEELGNDR